MINKTLSIVKRFYLGYLFLFFFNNLTNHLAYAKNALQIKNINKNIRR